MFCFDRGKFNVLKRKVKLPVILENKMNLNFGDPLIDARTRAFEEFEEVSDK